MRHKRERDGIPEIMTQEIKIKLKQKLNKDHDDLFFGHFLIHFNMYLTEFLHAILSGVLYIMALN